MNNGGIMAKKKISTPATKFLDKNKIDYELFSYAYEEKGGTAQTATELNVDENAVIKTLVFEDESKNCFLVLQHGDKKVSTKQLAREMNIKKINPATPQLAMKNTGYKFGGTSPFGTRQTLPIYAEKTIFELDRIYINGGGQGIIVGIEPNAMTEIFDITKVNVSQ
jgi:Cys-tRNA(Pro) deacylase